MGQAGVALLIVRSVGADSFPKGAEGVIVGHVAVRAAELVKGTGCHVGGGGGGGGVVLGARGGGGGSGGGGGGRGEEVGGCLEACGELKVADEGVDALVEL